MYAYVILQLHVHLMLSCAPMEIVYHFVRDVIATIIAETTVMKLTVVRFTHWFYSVPCTFYSLHLIYIDFDSNKVYYKDGCNRNSFCRKVCYAGSIRLTGGHSAAQGTVDLCIENIWAAICDIHWTTHDAEVVCRQLGFNSSELFF